MNLFDLLKWLANPLVKLVISLTGPVALILGTMADPNGAINTFIIDVIDALEPHLLETPESLKISNLIFDNGPVTVGQAVLTDVFQLISIMVGVVALVKLYKLIPFKAT